MMSVVIVIYSNMIVTIWNVSRSINNFAENFIWNLRIILILLFPARGIFKGTYDNRCRKLATNDKEILASHLEISNRMRIEDWYTLDTTSLSKM